MAKKEKPKVKIALWTVEGRRKASEKAQRKRGKK